MQKPLHSGIFTQIILKIQMIYILQPCLHNHHVLTILVSSVKFRQFWMFFYQSKFFVMCIHVHDDVWMECTDCAYQVTCYMYMYIHVHCYMSVHIDLHTLFSPRYIKLLECVCLQYRHVHGYCLQQHYNGMGMKIVHVCTIPSC